jgi:hypothetical protein
MFISSMLKRNVIGIRVSGHRDFRDITWATSGFPKHHLGYFWISETSPGLLLDIDTLPDITRHYQTLPDITRHYQTLPDIARHYQTLPDITRHYQTLPDITRHYRTLPDITGQQTLLGR